MHSDFAEPCEPVSRIMWVSRAARQQPNTARVRARGSSTAARGSGTITHAEVGGGTLNGICIPDPERLGWHTA
jgi:hypothetical protein